MSEYDNFLPRPTMEGFLRRLNFKSLKGLTENEIMDAIGSACEFFGISFPAFVQDLSNFSFGSTMFLNIDPTSYEDDILYYDMYELAQLHVGTKEAFSLIMTHECAHRVLQNVRFKGPYDGSWQNELAADFLMGCRAGLFGMNQINKVMEGLRKTEGTKSHPKGYLRADFIQQGLSVAQKIREESLPIPIPLKVLLVEYCKHYDEMLPYIEKDEKEIYNFFERMNR